MINNQIMPEEDLTLEQLKFAQWYLSHKKQLLKILTGFLIILNIIIWGIASYQFIIYLRLSKSHQEMLRGLTIERIDYVKLHSRFQPDDLVISDESVIQTIAILPGGKKLKYDFVAIARNPNEKWMVLSVEYCFVWDGGKTEIQKNFILPGEKKYLFVLGKEITKVPRNIQLELVKIDWRRIRPNQQTPLEILPELLIKDTKLTYVVPEEKMVSLPKISFSIVNQSVYNFWQLNLVIVLYRNSKIVGINALPVKYLKNGETKSMELIWGTTAPLVTRIEVKLEINVFDPTVFMPPN